MNSAVGRWVTIDGLVTLLLAANWIWFLLLLTVAIPTLFPEPPAESTSVHEPAESGEFRPHLPGNPLEQFEIPRSSEPVARVAKNDNPWVFPLMLALLAASAASTGACRMRRRGVRVPALIGYGGCAVFGLAFIGIQVYRFAEPSYATDTNIATLLLWHFVEHLSLSMLAGLALLLLASLVAVTRRGAEVPSLVEQATAWHWHALDTFWLVLVALAWHWGVMESL